MKSSQFLGENFVEDADSVHRDHEVQMAREELYHAAEYALRLHKLLRNVGEEQGLEGWVSSKITLANDYLKNVLEYMEYELMTAATQMPSELTIAEGSKKTPASNKPVDPKDLVVSLDKAVNPRTGRLGKTPRGYNQYDPSKEFPGVKAFKKEGVAEGVGQPTFHVSSHDDFETAFEVEMVIDNNNAGFFSYQFFPETNDVENDVDIHSDQYRGQGFGKLLLLKAIETAQQYGLPFKSDRNGVSPEQAAVYKSLLGHRIIKINPDKTITLAGKPAVAMKHAETHFKQGVAEGSLNEGQYEMMMRNGQVKKFIAKDDADAKRIAAGHGAKSVIRLKGGVPAGKVSEQDIVEDSLNETSAGSVATVVNPSPKNKAKTGTLFGGTYKQPKGKK